MRCSEKVVIVTGGSVGIGKGICLRLAEEEALIAINYTIHKNEAEDLANTIISNGGRAIPIMADVSVKDEVDRMVLTIEKHWGKIDALVNNAGICPFAEVLDITEELWDKTIDVNLKGTFLCSQAVARTMVKNKVRGSIVAISSINHYVGGKLQAHYGVTKSGQVNLMKSFALGLAPYGIRCNSILPGTIATDINKEFLSIPENYKHLVNRIPVGYIGEPSDIAHPVVYLVSDESRYVNGADFLIDGGALVNYL